MSVTLRYFAAARAAAGSDTDEVEATTLLAALDAVRAARPARLATVLSVCSFLVDGDPVGRRDPAAVTLAPGATVDVLPPFAGG